MQSGGCHCGGGMPTRAMGRPEDDRDAPLMQSSCRRRDSLLHDDFSRSDLRVSERYSQTSAHPHPSSTSSRWDLSTSSSASERSSAAGSVPLMVPPTAPLRLSTRSGVSLTPAAIYRIYFPVYPTVDMTGIRCRHGVSSDSGVNESGDGTEREFGMLRTRTAPCQRGARTRIGPHAAVTPTDGSVAACHTKGQYRPVLESVDRAGRYGHVQPLGEQGDGT